MSKFNMPDFANKLLADVNKATVPRCEGGNPVASASEPCEVHGCEACCEHFEYEDGYCLDCGAWRGDTECFDEDYGQDR